MKISAPHSAWNIVRSVIAVCIGIYSSILAFALFASMLDHGGLIPENSFLFGMDYIPPLWLFYLSVPGIVGLFLFSRKRAGLFFGLFSVFYLMLFGDIAFPAVQTLPRAIRSQPRPAISVMALNVRYYSFGLDRLLSYLQRVAPDIILLSEHELGEDGMATMRSRLASYSIHTGRQQETAVLSKYPVIECSEIELPTLQACLKKANSYEAIRRNPHRSFLHTAVMVDNRLVHIISVRFIAGRPPSRALGEQYRWGRYLLKNQLQEVAALRQYIAGLDGPVIFGGDLNAPPGSKIINELKKTGDDVYMKKHLLGLPTFRTSAPTMRLDYIFCSPGFIVLDAYRDTVKVSDHFPVMARVVLPPADYNGSCRSKKSSLISRLVAAGNAKEKRSAGTTF